MPGNGYKALGFVVWKGALAYLRWRSRPVRRVLAAGAVAGAGAAALARRRGGGAH